MSNNTTSILAIWDAIIGCIRRGNSAEVKREGGRIVVVEIQRKVKVKETVTTG